eukprot:TRINITY_DN20935_c0_g1_i1.p1 TRINITY_DN20935_c0_g1~~TRINITY_DN20935_c0_g1_i1.p1  ORF type:complete len:475 (+),score=85.71 TRINITY_DN20935_c0_g1_i1:236-1660(+)
MTSNAEIIASAVQQPACKGQSAASKEPARLILHDEQAPLLPVNLREHVKFSEAGGSSVSSAVYNLSTTIIGAGIMGLPAKMKILGLPFGLLALCGMGLLTDYSIQMLLRCSRHSGLWSYADLMSATWGRFGRGAMRFCVITNALGVLIIYMVIMGDVISGAGIGAEHHPGLLEQWAHGAFWWNSKLVVLTVISVFVLTPLCLLEKIDSLKHTSALSVFLAVVFVVITIAVSAYNLWMGNIDFKQIRVLPKVDTWHSIVQLATVIPTMSTAYVCHYNVHPIYVELAPPRWEKMRSVGATTLILCTSVYCATSLFGYMLFGEATLGDVLANFDADLHMPFSSIIADIVRLCYVGHLMMVFPVVHFTMRLNIDAILFPTARPLSESRLRYYAITVSLVSVILLGALFVPNIEFAFQFTGSVAAVSLAFTLPGLAALSNLAGEGVGTERRIAWFMVILGVAVSITGIACNVYNTAVGW